MKNSRFPERRWVALATAALVALAGSAAAQDTILEEVIVTATKRAENIQDIPISISTLSGEEAEAITAGGADIRVLRGRLPSLNIESSFGRVFPRFYIRGWGNPDFDINASQPVSLIYDEIVQENPVLKGFPIFDVDRIEVLRGPQGTLFGRNTPAGIVKIESVRPSQEAGGYASVSYGSLGAADVEAALGGGFGGNWSGRISAKYITRDDWVDNDFTGENDALEGFDEWAVRGQLMYEGEDFTALLSMHYRDLDGTARLFRANIIKPGTNDFTDDYDVEKVFIDGKNEQTLEAWGGVANLSWEFGNLNFISVTGYETYESFSRGDIDGGYGAGFLGTFGPGFIPFDAETADGVPDHEQITQEFRLSSNEWGRFDWTAGLFYFNEDLFIETINYETLDGNPAVDTVDGYVIQDQETDAWAVFASVDYDFTDRTSMRAGVRYSDDEKDYYAQRIQAPLYFLGQQPLGPVPANTDESDVSWDLALFHELSEGVNLYGRLASGFRAPSIQGRILFGDTVSVADSETSLSLEGGVKTLLAGGRVRLNANLFAYEVDDPQLTAVGGEANFNQVINAHQLDGYGFEADMQAVLTDQFLVTMGVSYNDTEIKDDTLAVAPCGSGCTVRDPASPTVPGAVLIGGNPLPQAPEWIGSLTARWSTPVGDGEFYVFGDWFYRSSVNFFLYDSVEYRGKSLQELGLRAGWIFGETLRQELAVFGRNVTDEEVIVGGIDFNNLTGFVNEPRIFGAEYRVNF